MKLRDALGKLKSNSARAFHFFFCEQGEDGKPVLLVSPTRIPKKKCDEILSKAKRKIKAIGIVKISEDNELIAIPKGSAPRSLAKGIQIVARNERAMIFQGITIGPPVADDEKTDGDQPDDGETDDDLPDDAETDDDQPDGAEEPPEGDSAQTQGAALRDRLAKLEAPYKLAMKVKPDTADVLKGLYERALEAAKGDNVKLAETILARLEPAIMAALKSAGTTQSESPSQTSVPNPKEAQFRKTWPALKQAWQDASDGVDSQIGALQTALKKTGDKDLIAIAERGLNGVTGNFKVPLMAAMQEINAATGVALQKAAARALLVVRGFQKHIATDKRVKACDTNPEVAVTIKQTLGHSLAQLETALQLVLAS